MRYVLCWLLLALFSTTCCLSQTPYTSGRAVLAIHKGVEGVFADPVRVLQAWKRQETRLNHVAAIQLRRQLVT
jgi:hypothetical protein